jgi:hypothetical protein
MKIILIAATAALTLQNTAVFAQTVAPPDLAYMDALKRYGDCITPIGEHWLSSMNQAAILYPRFGIAWGAQLAAIKAAAALDDATRAKAQEQAHEQFLDRMLRTAEPEAVEFYNLMEVARKQAEARCGQMPQALP